MWVTPKEISQIARYLGITDTEMRKTYIRRVGRNYSLVERQDNKDCIFLTNNGENSRKCLIYPVRPTQCQTWPFWPGNLRSPDQWAGAAIRCPGINRGDLHTCDEIEAKRKITPG